MKPIHQLHNHDKPREKLAAKGAQALKNEEQEYFHHHPLREVAKLVGIELLDHVILAKKVSLTSN